MADESPVLLEHDGGISRLIINRPAALNALNRATLEALDRNIDEIGKRDDAFIFARRMGDVDRGFEKS